MVWQLPEAGADVTWTRQERAPVQLRHHQKMAGPGHVKVMPIPPLSTLTSPQHTRTPLRPAALASVPYGIELVRVQGNAAAYRSRRRPKLGNNRRSDPCISGIAIRVFYSGLDAN